MNQQSLIGWGLALAALVSGYLAYGWPGVALALSVVVFWLMLQFSRALRAMRKASQSPVGTVPSAVMLHAQMKPGQRLIDLIQITRSLGEKLADEPETFRWTDDSGASVVVELEGGLCQRWRLARPDEADAPSPPAEG